MIPSIDAKAHDMSDDNSLPLSQDADNNKNAKEELPVSIDRWIHSNQSIACRSRTRNTVVDCQSQMKQVAVMARKKTFKEASSLQSILDEREKL